MSGWEWTVYDQAELEAESATKWAHEKLRAALAEIERLKASEADLFEEANRRMIEASDLRAQLAAARVEVAGLRESAQMACEEPQPGCDCSGCSYAREVSER